MFSISTFKTFQFAILNHFVSLKKCFTEKRTYVNKWFNLLNLEVSSNGFVVNTPKEITLPLRQFDWTRSYQNASLCVRSAHLHKCTEVRFASLFSGGFTTMAVHNSTRKETGKTHLCEMHCAMIIYAR